jgi:transposase-like protein
MKKQEKQEIRRSQRDYSMAFKMMVVSQVEKGEMTYKQAQRHYGIQGRSTVLVWLRKYSNLDWNKPSLFAMKTPLGETPAQKIKRLERQLSDERIKNSILNDMIDIMDNQYGTEIRKKLLPKQSKKTDKKTE